MKITGVIIVSFVAILSTYSSVARSESVEVPILTSDQRTYGLSEFGSEYAIVSSKSTGALVTLLGKKDLVLVVDIGREKDSSVNTKFLLSMWGELDHKASLPEPLRTTVKSLKMELKSLYPITVTARLFDKNDKELVKESFSVKETLSQFIVNADFKHVAYLELEVETPSLSGDLRKVNKLQIDNISLGQESDTKFTPPSKEQDVLLWLMQSAFFFFDANYQSFNLSQSFVSERQDRSDVASVSGLGYALAVYILAIEYEYMSKDEVKKRTVAILRWLNDQNWLNGDQGWHGFPYHWLTMNKKPHWPSVSTVDWAILAAGLRVTRQYFKENKEIVNLATSLLKRPDWTKAIDPNGKIAMGLKASDGNMDPYRWGLSFSEETELVYLEAVATKQLAPEIFSSIVRNKKHGFYPSWFGSGFTYNWLQLWVGDKTPLFNNSRAAYLYDLATSKEVFGKSYIGLTAGNTMTSLDPNGFANKKQYFSNQGSVAHGTDNDKEVVHAAPAPYGSLLALPFIPEEALNSIKNYIDLGFNHPYLGLPDTIRLGGLPNGVEPVPSWVHFDLNIGSGALAIDLYQNQIISNLYMNDVEIKESFKKWKLSFIQESALIK
jgi:hypothetical protein